MGLTICRKHGMKGTVFVCSHLYDAYKSQITVSESLHMKKEKLGSSIYLCANCVDKYQLKSVQVLDYDELQQMGKELAPVCRDCFEEFISLNKRKIKGG